LIVVGYEKADWSRLSEMPKKGNYLEDQIADSFLTAERAISDSSCFTAFHKTKSAGANCIPRWCH
jgi:hypothetical protein